MKKIILTLLLFIPIACLAQTEVFCGENKYDGEHKNEIQGFGFFGDNNVSKFFGGIKATYVRHLTEYVDVMGTGGVQFNKDIYTVAVEARYRIPLGKPNLYANARYLYNRYGKYELNEHNWNVGLTWEARYWDLRLGAYQTGFYSLGSHYTEPVSMQMGVSINARPRENKWNVGFFVRNYDYYYYDNWNINWGFHWNANLTSRVKLYGEVNIRPAGSMSQLANKYEWNMKFGAKYAW